MLKAPISADSHIVEPPNCYVDHIDPKYRDMAPRVGKNAKGVDQYQIEGLNNPIPIGLLAAAGMTPERGQGPCAAPSYSDITEAAYDPQARIEAQDRDGVGGEVIFASIGMVLCSIQDYDYKRACMQAYNRWLLEDFCSAQPNRLFGLAQSAVTLGRRGHRGLRGGQGRRRGRHDDDRQPPARGLRPRRLRRAVGVRGRPRAAPLPSTSSRRGTTTRPPRSSSPRGHKANSFMNLTRGVQDILGLFVFGGVFERHPDLHLVVAEADAGWVPHWMYRSDHAASGGARPSSARSPSSRASTCCRTRTSRSRTTRRPTSRR